MRLKAVVQALIVLMPWGFRRRLLVWIFGYRIHPSARIGLSIILARDVTLAEGSIIGHLTMIKGLDRVDLGSHAIIGNLNWITGFPLGLAVGHFQGEHERIPVLILKEHSAITNRHLIDCTNEVTIGKYSTFAGFNSQILTHEIDIYLGRQVSRPVRIGDYCFIGTRSILLPGSSVANRSVVAAGSVVVSELSEENSIYAGIPARRIKSIEPGAEYMRRTRGFVV